MLDVERWLVVGRCWTLLAVVVGRRCWPSLLAVVVGRGCWTWLLDVVVGRRCWTSLLDVRPLFDGRWAFERSDVRMFRHWTLDDVGRWTTLDVGRRWTLDVER